MKFWLLRVLRCKGCRRFFVADVYTAPLCPSCVSRVQYNLEVDALVKRVLELTEEIRVMEEER